MEFSRARTEIYKVLHRRTGMYLLTHRRLDRNDEVRGTSTSLASKIIREQISMINRAGDYERQRVVNKPLHYFAITEGIRGLEEHHFLVTKVDQVVNIPRVIKEAKRRYALSNHPERLISHGILSPEESGHYAHSYLQDDFAILRRSRR